MQKSCRDSDGLAVSKVCFDVYFIENTTLGTVHTSDPDTDFVNYIQFQSAQFDLTHKDIDNRHMSAVVYYPEDLMLYATREEAEARIEEIIENDPVYNETDFEVSELKCVEVTGRCFVGRV